MISWTNFATLERSDLISYAKSEFFSEKLWNEMKHLRCNLSLCFVFIWNLSSNFKFWSILYFQFGEYFLSTISCVIVKGAEVFKVEKKSVAKWGGGGGLKSLTKNRQFNRMLVIKVSKSHKIVSPSQDRHKLTSHSGVAVIISMPVLVFWLQDKNWGQVTGLSLLFSRRTLLWQYITG